MFSKQNGNPGALHWCSFGLPKITTFKILFCWCSGLNLERGAEAEFCGSQVGQRLWECQHENVVNAAGTVPKCDFNLSLCLHVSMWAGRFRRCGLGGCWVGVGQCCYQYSHPPGLDSEPLGQKPLVGRKKWVCFSKINHPDQNPALQICRVALLKRILLFSRGFALWSITPGGFSFQYCHGKSSGWHGCKWWASLDVNLSYILVFAFSSP